MNKTILPLFFLACWILFFSACSCIMLSGNTLKSNVPRKTTNTPHNNRISDSNTAKVELEKFQKRQPQPPPQPITCQVPFNRGFPATDPAYPDKGVDIPDTITCYKGIYPFSKGVVGFSAPCNPKKLDFTRQMMIDGQQIQTVWNHTGPHLQTIDNPMSDPEYQGYFLRTNAFEDEYKGYFPKNDQPAIRSPALRKKLSDQCKDVMQRFGKMLTEYRPESWNAAYNMHVENGTKWLRLAGAGYDQNDSFSFGNLGGQKAHGGPCLWCAKGIGNWIPTTIPLPYNGSPGAPNRDLQCTNNFAARVEVLEYKLPQQVSFHMGSDKQQACPLAVQPNGGVQILWRETGRAIGHILYLDSDLKPCAPDIVFEALDLGGIVAFNDGSLVLCAQKECDGPTTYNRFTAMTKVTVIYWKNGALQWVRTLTDLYRKSSQKEAFIENPEGSGDHMDNNNMWFAQLAYDDVTKTVSIYTMLTGGRGGLDSGGGHQGGRVFQLDLTGRVIHDTLACSHSWGLRMLGTPDGIHPAICADDGYGIHRVASRSYPTAKIWASVEKGGINFVKQYSLIKRKTANEFFMLFVYNETELGVMYLDKDLMMKKRIYMPVVQGRSVHSAQLMPYGPAEDDTYLLFWHDSKCRIGYHGGGSTQGGPHCNGLGKWQIIRFSADGGGSFTSVSEIYESSLTIGMEDNPKINIVNGDLLWVLVVKSWDRVTDAPSTTQGCYISLVRMKNCM